ncbi:MAG: 7-cyano-7-deazaguanine synthase [Methanocella sp.]
MRIPVVNRHAFQAAKDEIEYVLYLLSDDSWDIEFTRREGVPEPNREWPERDGSVLLFSGGLDSLAAAVNQAESGEPTLLVSHDSGNPVIDGSQQALAEYVSGLPGARIQHLPFRVRPQTGGGLTFPKKHESSQRTRSFLFLTLAMLVARREGRRRVIFIAENGQMAIHLPLTAARLGGFSTHTAHPEVVSVIQGIMSGLLGIDLSIHNPFLYMTKAEVVAGLCARHADAIEESVSCWRASRVAGGHNHCGECVPCLVRRIALEINNVRQADWGRDLLQEPIATLGEDDIGKRNLLELAEFAASFRPGVPNDQVNHKHPELTSMYFDQNAAIAMYRRWAHEAEQVLNRYPNVVEVLR